LTSAHRQPRFVRGLWALVTLVGLGLAHGCGSDTATDTGKATAPLSDEAKQQAIKRVEGGMKNVTKPGSTK
jgi:hypothetical protein